MISYNRGFTAVGEGGEQVYVKEYKKRVEEKIMEIIENHHQPKIFDVLQQLKLYIDELSKGSLQEESRYISMLRAALVKNFEFSLFIWQSDQEKNSFFSTATLRGICEDIITLNFISKLNDEDRTKLIETLFQLDLLETSKKQFDFLGKSQPLIEHSDRTEEEVKKLKKNIKSIAKNYPYWINLKGKLGYNGLPTINQMATFCNLEDLYKYLYAAASRWVHFNPNVLLRMGWGETKLSYKASTKNFSRYYLDFNRFYSIYLLLKFYDLFYVYLSFPKESNNCIENLRKFIKNTMRWPEIITYEELNRKPPSIIEYSLFNVVHSMKDEENQ